MNTQNIFYKIVIVTIFFASLAFLGKKANAQQEPMYTQYLSNVQMVNPGYVGTSDMANVTLFAREQWAGFDGAPTTEMIIINSPILKTNLGIGGSFFRDMIGPQINDIINIDLAYNFQVTKKSRLSLGLKGAVNFMTINYGNIETQTSGDDMFQGENKVMLPNFGAGIFWYGEKFYLGLSVPKLLETDYNLDNPSAQAKEEMHYCLVAAYLFDLNSMLKFKPTIGVKAVENAPLCFDVTPMFIVHESFWLGASYRYDDSFSGIIQYQFSPQLRVGYAYDFPTSRIHDVTIGSHEVMVSYDFNFKKNNSKIKSPRYF